MTYSELKKDALLEECVKRGIDVKGLSTKKKIIHALMDSDKPDEEPAPAPAPLPPVPAPVPVEPAPTEVIGDLTEEDVKKIMDENESDDDLCKAIISVQTDKTTGDCILPKTREELEELIRFNIEGNVNMICGKLHAKVKTLEDELSKSVKSPKKRAPKKVVKKVVKEPVEV